MKEGDEQCRLMLKSYFQEADEELLKFWFYADFYTTAYQSICSDDIGATSGGFQVVSLEKVKMLKMFFEF